MRIPRNRPLTHPGEILSEEILIPMGINQRDPADAIHVPFQRVNQIVSGKRGVTPSTALRLGKFFATSPGFWLNLQMKCDLQTAEEVEAKTLSSIRPRRPRPAAQ